jgi:hypothetical protein
MCLAVLGCRAKRFRFCRLPQFCRHVLCVSYLVGPLGGGRGPLQGLKHMSLKFSNRKNNHLVIPIRDIDLRA